MRWLTWSALWGIVAVSLWFLADWVLMTDRGLDLGDESLYLLEAAALQPDASYVFPFGWHTGPILELVGGDVAAFRAIGAVILGGAGIWVGMSAARLISAARGEIDRYVTAAVAVTGFGASWLFYFTLLRAPGYNWVTLVGMGIAVGAALRQWAQQIDPPQQPNRWAERALVVTIGFGTVFALAAKPTTPIFIGITYGVTAVSIVGFKRATRALMWVIAVSFLWIPILILIRWWPWNFVEVFWEATQRPLVTDNQSPPQALVNYLSIPWLAYRDFRGVSALPVGLVSVGLIAIATNLVYPWRYRKLLLAPFAVVLATTPWLAASNLDVWQQGWERGNLTVALLMVVAAMLLLGLGRWDKAPRVTVLQLMLGVFSLIALAGAFGFSSTNTPYPMMKFAGLLLAAAACLPLSRISDRFVRRSLAIALALGIVSTTTYLIVTSQGAPYSSSSLYEQTQATTVGLSPSSIVLDPNKAQAIGGMRDVIQEAGGSDVRLIAIGPNTPGIAFGSGATVPKSITLSWFGLPGDVALARSNLERLDLAEWCDAWMVTSPLRNSPLEGQTEQIATIFADFAERQWPSDYTLELQQGDFSLWKPNTECLSSSDGAG